MAIKITPWQYAAEMVEDYQSKIDKLKWHLNNNYAYIKPEEVIRIDERIRDFEQARDRFKILAF